MKKRFVHDPPKTEWVWCEYKGNRLALNASCYNDRREKGDKTCPYRTECVKGGRIK